MVSLFNNDCYKSNETPGKLVIFIHGYNGSPEAINYAIQWLKPKLQNTALIVPRAPFTCEKDANNLQWLSFYKSDPELKFRNPVTANAEIFEIFNRLGDDFAQTAAQMNEFINEQQQFLKISDENTFIMGFSQGAMISIYTALTRKAPLGGCIAIAGIIAGKDRLEKEIVSRPPFLILHGKDDTTVQYKTLPDTLKWMDNNKISCQVSEFDNLAHRINEAEIQLAADFINKREIQANSV